MIIKFAAVFLAMAAGGFFVGVVMRAIASDHAKITGSWADNKICAYAGRSMLLGLAGLIFCASAFIWSLGN